MILTFHSCMLNLDPCLNELDSIGRNILATNNHPFLEVVTCNDVMGKVPNTPVQHSSHTLTKSVYGYITYTSLILHQYITRVLRCCRFITIPQHYTCTELLYTYSLQLLQGSLVFMGYWLVSAKKLHL